MELLVFGLFIMPWLLPASLISVIVKLRQPKGVSANIFPIMLLSIPLTIIFAFMLFVCATLLEKWDVISPKGSEALGYFGGLTIITIFIASALGTFLAAKLMSNKKVQEP